MAVKPEQKLGIYIHIPFCHSKCDYCDFYSLAGREGDMDAYQKALLAHIKETAPLARHMEVDTIYFGGGTPSFLGADALATILTTIRRSFDVDPNAEITFEANPDSVSDQLLRRVRAEGFNRISLGVQNDDDEMLKKLGIEGFRQKSQKHSWKVCLIGFFSDFVGAAFLLGVLYLTDIILPNEIGESISYGLSWKPNLYSIIVILISIAISGVLIYVLNRWMLKKDPELNKEQIRRIALNLAVFTAPYLFLIPSSLIYR